MSSEDNFDSRVRESVRKRARPSRSRSRARRDRRLIMRANHVVAALLSGIITVESVTLVWNDLGIVAETDVNKQLLRLYQKTCLVIRPKKLAERTKRQRGDVC